MVASQAVMGEAKKPRGLWGFWALIVTQFQGAFNDQLIQFLVIFAVSDLMLESGTVGREDAMGSTAAMATILFSIPFIFFVGVSGALSDRFSKQRIAAAVKYAEVLIVCFGFLAFLLKMPVLLWILLLCMGTHSAFFSPAKYGILPEILPERRLSWGNGILQMGTIIAIIAGGGFAGPLYSALKPSGRLYLAAFVLLALTIIGLTTAQFITRPPAANPRQRIPLNPWVGVWGHFKILYRDQWLLFTVIGYIYFWFAGQLIRQNVLVLGSVSLGLDEAHISYVLASMAAGIGVGAVTAGFLSRGKIELGLVPIGTIGLAVFSGLLAWPGFTYGQYLGLLFGLGFFAGFFDVPLAATLQHRSPNDQKGGLMATTNMLTFVGMLAAGIAYWGLRKLHVSTYHVFLMNGVFSLGVGALMCIKLPYLPLRAFLWFMTNTFYRVRALNIENVPKTGGALLVGNHTAFLDPGVVLAGIDRPVRFLVFRAYYEKPWLRPFASLFGAIPVAKSDGPRALLKSLEAAGDAIRNGELVCVFPEGEITRIGSLLSFRRGFEQIMKGVDAPIIPFYIDGLWGSLFSFSQGRFFRKFPKHFPYPITINFGKPLPSNACGFAARSAIQELGADTYGMRKPPFSLIHRDFIREARRHPRLMAIADARSGALSYIKALVGSIVLARKLKPLIGSQPTVGVLVPPSVGGALANIALEIMGRVPINLNYTASAQSIASSAERCQLTHCITARAFLERLPVAVPGTPVYLEDILKTVTTKDRIGAFLMGLLFPIRLLERALGAPKNRSTDDLGTVIFSSGSEGEPKGVMLTHLNLSASIGSLAQVIPYKRGDVMMGFLPFFHSFGFMGTLWAPLTHGMSVVYHPSPLEPKAIGNLVQKYKAFLFIGTPTFLQNFVRRCTVEEMKSVRFVLCGAEKMPPRVRDAFIEKFGIEPREAYGATECAPGISVGLPDFHHGKIHQKGSKRGSVGRPLPGVAVRALDPDTGAVLGANEPGLLQVKGPNIMKGYLGMPEKTAAVIQDGWYSTGDIAMIDEEGFITITDRLARFSKIAGEMISHTKVEETLHGLLGLTEQALAVASVPDATRGERLIVLHTLTEEQLEELLSKLEHCDLPNLWRPRPNAFYRVDAIPVLGTGKMDIKAVRSLARKLDMGDTE